jgi:hypothetical protein
VLVVLVDGEAEDRNIIDASRSYLIQDCQATNLLRPDCIRGDTLDSVELRNGVRDNIPLPLIEDESSDSLYHQ